MMAVADPAIERRRQGLVEEMAAEFYPRARPEVVLPVSGSPGIAPSIKLRSVAGRPSASLLVIIPFKDHADQTLACVESIERQRHDLDVRVILVDTARLTPRRARYFEAGSINLTNVDTRWSSTTAHSTTRGSTTRSSAASGQSQTYSCS